jgi:hypothetical protein
MTTRNPNYIMVQKNCYCENEGRNDSTAADEGKYHIRK